ncbi:MAG: alpha/beta fold hydrolase [Proteobacteria bacterium]|uniref:alpha/beta fold hydrolase n=1 Tax=Aquabacterium sp. TaxID=1872578 RepID=UPI0035C6B9F2|nr:alpha/beta fold hydrolase [Pseudomonadota bacterium]
MHPSRSCSPALGRLLSQPVHLVLIGLSLVCAAWWPAPARAAASEPQPWPVPWPVLTVSEAQSRAYVVSDEARFAQTDWQGIEQATMALAERRIGSFEGAPTGLTDRPVRIHHRFYEHRQEQRGAVIVVPGFTEGLSMYQEVIHDLVRNGHSVYIHDHRGQGFSSRLLSGADQADKGHVDRFDRLVSDLETFTELVRRHRAADPVRARRPLFVLAHSMGGAVVALHLERRGADTPFAAAALVTPMFEPTVVPRGSQRWSDRGLRQWCHSGAFGLPFSLPGVSALRVRGGGFAADLAAFEALPDPAVAPLTHSVLRHRMRWRNRAALCTGADCGHADARVAGPTLQWVDQACAASEQARGPAAGRIAVPVLVLQGGEDETVEPEAQREFCAQAQADGPGRAAGGRCVGERLPEARHGLLVEADRLRQPALVRVFSFWDDVVRRTP